MLLFSFHLHVGLKRKTDTHIVWQACVNKGTFEIKICFCSYFAQNIDCGYSLEPPTQSDGTPTLYDFDPPLLKNKTCAVFFLLIVGFKGVYIKQAL